MEDATLAQGNQLVKLILQAKDPKRFLQNLISNWGAVQVIGRGEIDQATFQVAIKDIVNPFVEDKTNLRWFYPRGWEPIGVLEQLSVLQGFYPDLNGSRVIDIAARITVPKAADGLFVCPKPSGVAAKLGISEPFGEGYGQMLEASVLDHLARQRRFYNCHGGNMTSDDVRMRQTAVDAIRKLEAEHPEGDFLVFPAQTGLKWGGYSPQNACWEIEHKSEFEFPLPAWFGGHIILSNQARLKAHEILVIDCPGDKYRFGGGSAECLSFSFDSGRLVFGGKWLNYSSGLSGSASGFFG